MIAQALTWVVGVLTGAYLTHALHPLWCARRGSEGGGR